jgi:hypothetical protein
MNDAFGVTYEQLQPKLFLSAGPSTMKHGPNSLQQLANNLADCDAPIDDRTLVHQLVTDMNTKYHTLRSLRPALLVFPSFMQACGMLLLEERSQFVSDRHATDTALVATATRPSSVPAPHLVAPTNNAGGVIDKRTRGGYGRGRDRGHGRGFHYNGGGRSTQQQRPASSRHGSAHGLLPGACHGLELLVSAFLEHAPRLRHSRCFNNLTPPSRHFSNHHGTHQASSRRSRPLLYSGKQAPEIGLWNTGASSHMTNNSGNLPFIILHHRLIPHMLLLVTDPNFLVTVPVIHLCIHHHIFVLPSVLHLPHLIKNLIYVRRFTTDNSCTIEFDPYSFSAKDLATKKIIMRSNSFGDLYPFFGTSSASSTALLAHTASIDVCHHCLGHPNKHSLARLLAQFLFSCNKSLVASPMCEACQEGKHVRLPFPHSMSFTYFPFQIIHCNLWTSPISSISGFQYYLIILDDYAHYVWTFLIRHKSEVPTILRHFYVYVRNQFHLSIQSI